MLQVTNKDYPAGSSSQNDATGQEGGVDSKRGSKPSLAERNRERQQRFRQRQKSRIEELETRCQKLTQQARALAAEKEDLAKNLSLLKNLVQVRDVQLLAVTSQLAQYIPNSEEVKAELQTIEGLGSVESLLQRNPNLQALEALQSARMEAQAEVAHLHAEALHGRAHEGPSSTDTESHEPLTLLRTSSPASALRLRSHSPQLALDQLCRVAEMAEKQRAGSSSPVSCKPEPASFSAATAPLIFSHLSSDFCQSTDVVLIVEGEQLHVHSAFLAARSNWFARKFVDIRHSQPLYPSQQEPMMVDTGIPGKRVQEVLLFLHHCYGILDLTRVADADVLRLIMLADEFEAKELLEECDTAIMTRAEGKRFSYFADLSRGGDVVDWIRLSDRLGLSKVSGICEMHLAKYLKENRLWRENTRLNELGHDCLLRVINKLAEL